ncbi:MAG: hypothetical protein M3401_03525 [Actinomycetota bacterium]|nr:hypothetical protein [Actinomycetota bacterium]
MTELEDTRATHVNVVQGYYALNSLLGDEVPLYGEEPPGAPQVLPAHAIAELREPLFDLDG